MWGKNGGRKIIIMTLEEAQQEIIDYEALVKAMCSMCSYWGCPSNCDMLDKAKEIPLMSIQKSYARNDGDLTAVARYIKRKKIKG